MRLFGDVACHGLVVGVEVRIIVDLQRQRAERCRQLRGKYTLANYAGNAMCIRVRAA